jgi:hypothetical protein
MGAESGFTSLPVAGFVGGLIPGGGYAGFPPELTFLKAGADGGADHRMAVPAFHRMVMLEVPMLGFRFALVRVLSSPPLARLVAEALPPAFPHLAARQ